MSKIISEENYVKRNETIDVAKGIGIFLMVLGHMHINEQLNLFIYSFHMPLFYIISGFLYKNSGGYYWIKKKAKSLLVPYFCFGIVYILISFVLSAGDLEILKRNAIGLFYESTNNLPIESALWFLTSMFFLLIIVSILEKIDFNSIKLVLIVFLTVVGSLFPNVMGFRLPMSIDTSLVTIGFFYVGYYIKKHFIDKKSVNKCVLCSLLTVICSVSLFVIQKNEQLNIRLGNWGIFPITYFTAIFISVFTIYFSSIIKKHTKVIKKNLSIYR